MNELERLLERMQAKKAGWKASDLQSLYGGFGFEQTEGSNHTLYRHPKHRELRATVKRHTGDLPQGYVAAAVRNIRRLKELQAEEEAQDEQEEH